MAGVEWVKLSTDMFNNRKIKYLRSLPEGNNIILIWIMLLTLAGKCNAGGMIFLTENVPYTKKMLSDELHFDENIVTLAINALEKLGMISFYNEQMVISSWEEHQNIQGLERIREQNRLRQARYRANYNTIEEKENSNVTHNVTVTQSNATEKNKNKNRIDKENISIVQDFFESIWNLYPNKRGKGQVKDTQKKKLYDIGFEEMKRAINRYKDDLQIETWRKPQNGSTFFNSGYVDYLDKNYIGGDTNNEQTGRTIEQHAEQPQAQWSDEELEQKFGSMQ